MFQTVRPLVLICETSLHAGSGSELGLVDLPIQREKHTNFPKIESSSLKGAIREACENSVRNGKNHKAATEDAKKVIDAIKALEKDAEYNYDKKEQEAPYLQIFDLFGPEDQDTSAHAGCMAFTDARLLLFPVRSAKGIFAWITCPYVLQRWARDTNNTVEIAANQVASDKLIVKDKKIVLEEYAFTVEKSDKIVKLAKDLAAWVFSSDSYWKNRLEEQLVILSDEDFKVFVTMYTEVVTRNKINNETGTVEEGALFQEEYLPPDSVLYSMVYAAPVFESGHRKRQKERPNAEQMMKKFEKLLPSVMQLGGNRTIGKGILRTNLKQIQ